MASRNQYTLLKEPKDVHTSERSLEILCTLFIRLQKICAHFWYDLKKSVHTFQSPPENSAQIATSTPVCTLCTIVHQEIRRCQ